MLTNTNRSVLSLSLFALYCLCAYFFNEQIDSFGFYASYILESAFVGGFIFLNKEAFKDLIRWDKRILLCLPLLLILGWLTHRGAGWLGIVTPFDLRSLEMLVLLFVVSPVLEELIFRFFIWKVMEEWIGSRWTLIASTILFSYSHFQAIFPLPKEFHPFILYQTGYTLLLGALCGLAIAKLRSLPAAIAFHVTFNVGFILSSLM